MADEPTAPPDWDNIETMTLVEVVGDNVARWREIRGWGETELARRMSTITGKTVSRERIMAIQGTRKGANQVEPSWSELVALTRALDCSIYDLTLPPADAYVLVSPWGDVDTPIPGTGAVIYGEQYGRDQVMEMIYRLPIDVADNLDEFRRRYQVEHRGIYEMAAEVGEQVRLASLDAKLDRILNKLDPEEGN